MLITARLFASFREAVGAQSIALELGSEPTVGSLKSALREQFPQLGPALESAMVAVNLDYVGPAHELRPGDEVAIIPPVSGGAQREL